MIIFTNEMIFGKTHQKVNLSKWLLSVVFLFNILSFSEYVGHLQILQQTNPVELVISFKLGTKKQTVSYNKALRINNTVFHFTKAYEKSLLFTYNRLSKVKFDNYSNQIYIIGLADFFYQIKTIPQSTKEHELSTFIG